MRQLSSRFTLSHEFTFLMTMATSPKRTYAAFPNNSGHFISIVFDGKNWMTKWAMCGCTHFFFRHHVCARADDIDGSGVERVFDMHPVIFLDHSDARATVPSDLIDVG